MVTHVPLDRLPVMAMRPLWARAISRAMARPSPEFPVCRSRLSSRRTKRPKLEMGHSDVVRRRTVLIRLDRLGGFGAAKERRPGDRARQPP